MTGCHWDARKLAKHCNWYMTLLWIKPEHVTRWLSGGTPRPEHLAAFEQLEREWGYDA